MELVFPTIQHKQAAMDFRQEHIDNGETHINGSGGLLRAEDYESWLDMITKAQTAPEIGLVNRTTYFAFIDNKIVGIIQIRHTLDDSLINTGGHIGYNVRPSERRKGYAAKMLSLALDKCHEWNIDKALVTCNEDNVGSAKTILKNGGVLENVFVEENGNVVQRYWISL